MRMQSNQATILDKTFEDFTRSETELDRSPENECTSCLKSCQTS